MLRRQVFIVRCLQVRNIVHGDLTPRLVVKRAGGNNEIITEAEIVFLV